MARPLRVVAVTPFYPPDSLVGAWLTTHEFLRHLVTRGHSVTAVAYLGVRGYTFEGVTVHARTADADTVLAGCDVMVSHLGDNGQAAEEAAHRGIPMVRMVHGFSADAADKLAAHPCALAVFNSQTLRDAINHDCPSIVAHPPLDHAAHRTTPGRRVTLVNLSKPKGGALFWQLAASMPDVQFTGVVGGYGNQLSDKAKNVTIIPTTSDMRRIWCQTGILLMPSEAETWGRVGLEAMVSGIPVIAHPTPGLAESLGGAGVFCDRNKPERWEREIRRLLGHDEWAAASVKAKAHAEAFDARHQLEVFASALEAV